MVTKIKNKVDGVWSQSTKTYRGKTTTDGWSIGVRTRVESKWTLTVALSSRTSPGQ